MIPRFILAIVISLTLLGSKRTFAQDHIDTLSKYTINDPIEINPEFPGGNIKFKQFIQSNLRKIKGAEGKKVFISFTVEKDGTLNHFKVERGVNEEADKEALRVIKSSPKWKPGMQAGISMREHYTVPVLFN